MNKKVLHDLGYLLNAKKEVCRYNECINHQKEIFRII